ncbi:MAG: Ig-like domain-containing protein [Ruminococcus sp.]
MAVKTKRSTALFISIILLFAVVFSQTSVSSASYPTTHPNTYKNTGNGALDIVGVARTQIGYKQVGGTKYGYWYNELFVNQPWCAMFVSWCADQAGVSQTILPKHASCSSWVKWFQSQGLWKDSQYYGGNYTPKAGDVVFYRNSGSSAVSDHTGVVVGTNGSYLHVIEGNSTNVSVCEFKTNSSRMLKSSYVIGYGTPKYSGSSTTPPEDEPTDHEQWQVTDADVLMLRSSYSTSSEKLTTISMGQLLKVTDFKQNGGYLWGYTKHNGKTGWCALDYCTYIQGNIDGEYYQLPPSVSPTSLTLYATNTKKLSVTNGLGASYSSSDKAVATVNKNGKITAVSKGSATITCKTNTGSAKCKLTVNNPEIDQEKPTVCIGDKIQLTVSALSSVDTWESSDKTVAKVDASGNVKGIGAGKATITATKGEVKASVAVTVTKEPTTYQNFTVKSQNAYLYDNYMGNKKVLIPVGTPLKVTSVKYSDTYTWGQTTYKSTPGWVIISKCTYVNGSINGKVYLKRPFLKETEKSIYLKGTYTITVKSKKGASTFTSQNPKIASVSKDGVVTALSAGTTTIDVVNNNTKLKFKVTVLNPVLSHTQLDLFKGKTFTLTVKGGDGTITWSSSNKEVAKVNKNGVVTAIGYGTATIKAKRNGILTTCEITVFDPILSKTTQKLKVGEKLFLTVSQNKSDSIIWKSSNKNIVKVGAKGKLTGIAKGRATVTATVDGYTLSCVVKVVE